MVSEINTGIISLFPSSSNQALERSSLIFPAPVSTILLPVVFNPSSEAIFLGITVRVAPVSTIP
jgi:hypothetical protein